jgi:hypothetical protein
LDLDLDLTFGVVAAVPVAKIDEPYSQYPQTLSDWHANCFPMEAVGYSRLPRLKFR